MVEGGGEEVCKVGFELGGEGCGWMVSLGESGYFL